MLVNTIENITAVVPVNALNGFATFKPYIEKAERWIKPVLSTDLYDKLGASEQAESEALKLTRICIVNYAMWDGFDMLNVTHDDSGFRRASKEQSLYRYQEENLRAGFKSAAFDGIDALLEYLQSNIADYPEFEASTFYVSAKGSIFPDTSSFNKVYNIGNSRLVFLQLSAFFDRVIDFELRPVLTSALYESFIGNLSAEDSNADLSALLPMVRKVLAFYAVAYGVDELGLRVTDKGLYFDNEAASGNSHIQTQRADVESLRKKALLNAARYKAMLLEYLQAHSDKYDVSTEAKSNPYRRNNDGKKTAWY